jgi:hypothetical protein
MATQRRKEPEGRVERERSSLSEKARHGSKAAPTRRGKPSRLFLRQNDWDEEEIDFREDRERPKQPD